jgi:hypothetical protein
MFYNYEFDILQYLSYNPRVLLLDGEIKTDQYKLTQQDALL